jgi:hypothetical protein
VKADLIVRWPASRPAAGVFGYEYYAPVQGSWHPIASDEVQRSTEDGERVFYATPADLFTADDETLVTWLASDEPTPSSVLRPRIRINTPDRVPVSRDTFTELPPADN